MAAVTRRNGMCVQPRFALFPLFQPMGGKFVMKIISTMQYRRQVMDMVGLGAAEVNIVAKFVSNRWNMIEASRTTTWRRYWQVFSPLQ